jgi:uncharacterized protein YndB with AHSA1/START domain
MKAASVQSSMLIRRPAGEVFSAFVNPQVLRKFWLADASGPLGPGARVKWQFMVPGAAENVVVTQFEAPRHLAFDWSEGIHVDIRFEAFGDDGTQVIVTVGGFSAADTLTQASGTAEGFAVVLCDLKTLLESGESAHLVRDKAELIIAAQSARGG